MSLGGQGSGWPGGSTKVENALIRRVRLGGFLGVHEGDQGLVDAGVPAWRLVIRQHLFPQTVGPRCGIQAAVDFPLFQGIIVGDLGQIEGLLEIFLGVGAAEEMSARPNFVNGVQGLAVFTQVDALAIDRQHAELVAVHDKFFVG